MVADSLSPGRRHPTALAAGTSTAASALTCPFLDKVVTRIWVILLRRVYLPDGLDCHVFWGMYPSKPLPASDHVWGGNSGV